MFVKLALASLLALAAAAPQHQQPAKYPAGVNPSLCPGFPICDNALLHNPQPHWAAQPQAHWHQPAPQHNQWDHHNDNHWDNHNDDQYDDGQWRGDDHSSHQSHQSHNWNAPALHGPASNHLAGPAAEKYPAGISPHTCPNYPFCDVNAGHHHGAAAPLPGFTERLYPAGVSPHTCPNFPYCS